MSEKRMVSVPRDYLRGTELLLASFLIGAVEQWSGWVWLGFLAGVASLAALFFLIRDLAAVVRGWRA